MVKVTPSLKSLIIQKYLYRHSLSEIAYETGVSKTTAHNITTEWMSKVSVPDIAELRRFLDEMRKSGITILECVQGFRTAQILRDFGIKDDEFEEWMDDDDKETENTTDAEKSDSKINLATRESLSDNIVESSDSDSTFINKTAEVKTKDKKNQITYFMNSIYNNCKAHGIKPAIIVRWIEDLFHFYSISDYNILSSDEDNIVNYSKHVFLDAVKKESIQKNDMNDRITKEIPLVSRVSYYIEQKKKKIERLQDSMNSISKEIDEIEKEKRIKRMELNHHIEKEKKAFFYSKWYDNLKQELLYKHNLLIEQEFGTFAASINDFKQYNFDATQILAEHKNIDSLRKERDHVQFQINQNTSVRDKLLNEISSLKEQRNQHSQIIKAYQQLDKEGFRLKEFKQLINLVEESALENGFEVKDSIKKFLKDVEDQYDNKLGFEKKVDELKAEMKKLKDEIPGYKSHLTLRANVTPTLTHLVNSGVTSEDIIGMNHLVLEFKNNGDFLSDPINKNNNDYYNSNTKTNNNNMTRTQYWYVFVEKLKELKNINTEINKQASSLNYLKTQISDLIANKQKIENAYADSVGNLNQIIVRTHQFLVDMTRQIGEPVTSKKILPVPILFPVLVDFDSSHDNDPTENQDSL